MPRCARTLCIAILLLAPALTVAQVNKPGLGNPPGGKNPGGAKPPAMPPVGPGGAAKPGAPGGVAPGGAGGPNMPGNFVVPKEVAGRDFEYWKKNLDPQQNRDAYLRQLA